MGLMSLRFPNHKNQEKKQKFFEFWGRIVLIIVLIAAVGLAIYALTL